MRYDAFISYRRDGGSETARLIKTLLEKEGLKIFLDVDELRTGVFDVKLLDTIAESNNFILILTPGSLERCQGNDDWLRKEINQALRTSRNIIPIFKDEFAFPGPESLPNDIQDLPRYNGLPFNHTFFSAFIQLLISRMETVDAVTDGKTKAKYSFKDLDSESIEYCDVGLEHLYNSAWDDALLFFQKSIICKPNAKAYLYSAITSAFMGAEYSNVDDLVNASLRVDEQYSAAIKFRELIDNDLDKTGNEITLLEESLKKSAAYILENECEYKRTKTIYEHFAPASFTSKPVTFWLLITGVYFLGRAIFNLMSMQYSMAVASVAEYCSIAICIGGTNIYSKYFYKLYYPLKNQVEIKSRNYFSRWYDKHVQKTLGFEPSGVTFYERSISWSKQNRLLIALMSLIMIIYVPFVSYYTDYSNSTVTESVLLILDQIVLWSATCYPISVVLVSFMFFVEYAKLSLKPIISRLNIYPFKKVIEMIKLIGGIVTAYFFCIQVMALSLYRQNSVIELYSNFINCLLVASWTLGMPIALAIAYNKARRRILSVYAKYIEDAFIDLISSPDEKRLGSLQWYMQNIKVFNLVKIMPLSWSDLVILIAISLSAFIISVLYIIVKTNQLRDQFPVFLDNMLHLILL